MVIGVRNRLNARLLSSYIVLIIVGGEKIA